MQKEVFLAIIFGSILGLLVAYGVWRTNSTLDNRQKDYKPITQTNNQNERTNDLEPNLGVVTPVNLSAVTSSPIVVTGIVNDLENILISTNSRDYLISVIEKEFSQEIELDSGLNQIIFSGFSNEKVEDSELLQVAYSNQIESDEPLRTSIGVITDITEDYIQLRDQNGEIVQVGLVKDTSYTKSIGNSKEIEFADLAIGDFVVAIGQISELEVLEALRVIVTTEPQKLEITTAKGIVNDFDRSSITLNGQEYEYNSDTAFMDTNADNADFFLKEGQEIIIVGTPIIRSVFLL